MMQAAWEIETEEKPRPERPQTAENRWCERHGYFIDVEACRARARQRQICGRCLARWRQLSLPFPEPF
ncbi:MAG: hypothetical protein NT047_04600 [Deltaproteobacteria bacterium]|nr:hypothetical protein [Deltaproteobacteria bacterium]